jgi:formylglycine-generating enzyme required for sulfatase activity
MDDEKSRRFLDWVLGGTAPKAVKDGLKGLGEFSHVERAAHQILGPGYEEVLIACRVILYFEERLKTDPGPSKSTAACFVPIRQFMVDFFSRHPEFVEYRPLLDYYLTKAGLSEETIYAPPEDKPKERKGALTGWFAAVTDRLTGKDQQAPSNVAVPKTEAVIRCAIRRGQGKEADRGKDRVAERGGCELVYVPSGRFTMGSAEGEQGREEHEWPVHEVYVRSFYLCRYLVTNEEYGRFLKACGAKKPDQWADPQFNRPRQPVVGVNWEEANRFAEWAGGRLPSEAEWEYACRAGKKTPFCSGDGEQHLARVGWYRGNSGGKLHEVGEKEVNGFGLYDMHGNVWEWCEDDWHGSYEGAPADGSAWIDKSRSSARVARGGAFLNPPGVCRSAFRFRAVAVGRNKVLGFRIAVGLIGG